MKRLEIMGAKQLGLRACTGLALGLVLNATACSSSANEAGGAGSGAAVNGGSTQTAAAGSTGSAATSSSNTAAPSSSGSTQTAAAGGAGAAAPSSSTAAAGSSGSSAAGSSAPRTAGSPAAAGGTGGSGAAEDESFWPADCEERYKLVAHGQPGSSDTSMYEVPGESEYYASFFFKAPWGSKEVQGLAFRSIIDNPKIVHHWILYGVNSATSQQDGALTGGPAQFLPTSLAGEAFINGWAPGAQDTKMPDDVGLYMPHGEQAMFRLEVHYNNATGAEKQMDRSGVEFCVTSKKRTNEAATHWLGTANFSIPAKSKLDVVSTCVPKVETGPVHIMSMSPHMHKTGVHAKAVLKRADGTEINLMDGPFDFAYQRAMSVPTDGSIKDLVINKGDTITTTCGFENDTDAAISFGENTSNEMCFFFTTAWPRGGLSNGQYSLIPGAEPAVNCLQ
jgi:hypothetical protein